MDSITYNQLQIFKSLFRGREDVFAIRWEKAGNSGYTPAYDFNWEEFSRYKASGGSLKDFPHKQFSKLTNQRLINHLTGKEIIGLYPLLTDNSSWFIVADFDESPTSQKTWIEECLVFIKVCKQNKMPAYLERSRSGKGGHVWIFFASAYPAYKSRKIVLHLLESAGILSVFENKSNYDRVFPNQDFHSGKGLGNLIALPLQKSALEANNSCFIHPETLEPAPNQWAYLENIEKVDIGILESFFESVQSTTMPVLLVGRNPTLNANEIQIILSNQISIPRSQITSEIIEFLRGNLNFINSEYLIRKRLGKNTFGIEPYFRMIEEKEGIVFLPKGFIGRLLRFLTEQRVKFVFIDQRQKLATVHYPFKAEFYDYQLKAIEAAEKKQMGIIVAPPGAGKTIIGLGLIANKRQPALVIVHRKQLFEQWVERIQSFLGIAKPFIGKIAPGKFKIGAQITVAMIQSLPECDSYGNEYNSFGTIIIDECHHVPAKTFRDVIKSFNSCFLYGLTATPVRKTNDEKLIFIHIGDVIHEIKLSDQANKINKFSVIIRESELVVPFDYKTDKPETLNQILIHDAERNRMIIEDIKLEANTGKKVLVLTERKAHIEVLYQYLKGKYEVIAISGDDSVASKKEKFRQINEGDFQVLIATGQLLGEGADFNNLECLILAYPFAFEGKLIQYIGRVQRSGNVPIIYDYRDIHIDYLDKQFKERNRYYRKLLSTNQIHKFDELYLIFEERNVFLNSSDCVLSIDCLDLSLDIEKFQDDVVWKIRVMAYDEESGVLAVEIMNYDAHREMSIRKQREFQFLIIDKISFRNIDTGQLLKSVVLKKRPFYKIPISEPEILYENLASREMQSKHPIERILNKTMKVPFHKIQFKYAGIAFLIFIEELQQEILFEIGNPEIRPEFEAIKEYFTKILKKKLIDVELAIRFNEGGIVETTAKSEDINKINSGIIDSVRLEFVKKELISFKGKPENVSVVNTINSMSGLDKGLTDYLFRSDQDLVDNILNIKNSKHYLNLKFLSSQHISSILKIRFILNPFSFLFLLSGDRQYHIIWETLDSKEATYIWHFEKTMDALRKGIIDIESILNEIKASCKQDYLRQDHGNFSRVIHDYTDPKAGFTIWKGMLEEKLI